VNPIACAANAGYELRREAPSAPNPTGMERSITRTTASAWEATPWHAVQAWRAGRAAKGMAMIAADGIC